MSLAIGKPRKIPFYPADFVVPIMPAGTRIPKADSSPPNENAIRAAGITKFFAKFFAIFYAISRNLPQFSRG
jgi:hypothetical protein